MSQTNEEFMSDSDILDIVLDAEQEMLEAVQDTFDGHVNPLIIKGPPGVGKTQSIEEMAINAGVTSTDFLGSEFNPNEKNEPTYPYRCDYLHKVEGALIRGADYSVWAMVADLYANKDSGILVFDDNDLILKDKTAVALIMKATEQKAKKMVSYTKANSTHELQMYGVQSTFEVNTPIVILTNIDMQDQVSYFNAKHQRDKKPKPDYIERWEAMISRGKYIDLQMNSPRSIRVFCEHKIKSVKMLTDSAWLEKTCGRSLTEEEQEVALKWIRKNQGKLKNALDLRVYNKLANIMIRRNDWEKSAELAFLK